MDQMTIRNLDEAVLRQLQQAASKEGVPLDDVLRRLLAEAARVRTPAHLDRYFPAPTD